MRRIIYILISNSILWLLSQVVIAQHFDTILYPESNKMSNTDAIDFFLDLHQESENYHNITGYGDGSWESYYEMGWSIYDTGYPLIRSTSRRVLAYIQAYRVDPRPIYQTRAQQGLTYLINNQDTDGSFPWEINISYNYYHRAYETGLAGRALIEGYRWFGTQSYLTTAEDAADWHLANPQYEKHPSDGGNQSNVNMYGFAAWHLASVYQEDEDIDYLDEAVTLCDSIMMWQNYTHGTDPVDDTWYHCPLYGVYDKQMVYHCITLRGMLETYRAVEGKPAYATFRSNLENSIVRAINYMINEQASNSLLKKESGSSSTWVAGLQVLAIAHEYLTYGDELNPLIYAVSPAIISYGSYTGISGLNPWTRHEDIMNFGQYLHRFITYWEGTTYVDSSIIISPGITLIVCPGAEVKFNDYYSISVKAGSKIIAEGTSTDPILFTSTSGTSPQSWKNIYVYGSHNRLEWCTFEYGDWSLKVEGYPSFASDNVIKNCTFHDNDQALRIHKNDADVINCEIYDNCHALVCYNNTEVKFYGNHIYDNDRDGVYSWTNNYLYFYGNVIENNGQGHSSTCNGIYTFNSDAIDVYQYNTIRTNYHQEIKAYYGYPYVDCLQSSIHDVSGYEIYNYPNNVYLYTDYCWFGESPPNYNQFYGDVEIESPMSSQPGWEGTTNDGGMGKAIAPVLASNPEIRDEEKIIQLKKIINTRPFSDEADNALLKLYSIIRRDYLKNEFGEKEVFYDYLEGIYQSYEDIKLGKTALVKMIMWKMLEGDDSSVIVLSNEALKVLSGEDRMCVLENLACLYTYLGKIEKAKTCLEECKEKYSFDQAGIQFIEEELADVEQQIADGIRIGKETETNQDQAENISYSTEFGNFPNPTNPATTIHFYLPAENRTRLKIVNVLGQEVKTLIDEVREAGHYSVLWDGKNNIGSEAQSGIYICTLQIGKKLFTKKLTLMK